MKKILLTAFTLIILCGWFVPLNFELGVNIAHAETVQEAAQRMSAAYDKAEAAANKALANRNAARDKLQSCNNSFGGAAGLNCSGEKAAFDQSNQLLKSAEQDVSTIATLTQQFNAQKFNTAAEQEAAAISYANQMEQFAKRAEDSANGIANSNPSASGANISKESTPGECAFNSNFSLETCIKTVASWIAYFILFTISWLVGFAGLLFNTVLVYTVVAMKDRINEIGAINTGWVLFRDLGNLIFIFILLYVAIKTILGMEDANTKKLIRNIIIIGLLVNFSLFFTKFLIDGSNILSISFYNQITTNPGYVGGTGGGSFSIRGFSEKFTAPLGIESLWSPNDFITKMSSGSWTVMIITAIGGTIFLLMVAFTFLYAAALFIIRFVVLVVLMIVSPAAFVAYILPNTRRWWNKWWDALAGQLIFAPLYLLLMFLVLTYANNIPKSNAKLIDTILLKPTQISSDPNTAMAAALNFIILIGFMNVAAIVATSFASQSGGVIGKAVGYAEKKVGIGRSFQRTGTVTGTVARGTVGRVAAEQDEKLSRTGFGSSRFGRWARSYTTGAAAGAKFGTDQSSQQIRDKNRKENEAFARRVETGTQIETNKTAESKEKMDTHRTTVITNADQKITTIQNEAENVRVQKAKEIRAKEEQARALAASSKISTQRSTIEAEANRLKKQAEDIEAMSTTDFMVSPQYEEQRKQIKELQKTRAEAQVRRDSTKFIPATRDERQEILTGIQKEKATELEDKNKETSFGKWARNTKTGKLATLGIPAIYRWTTQGGAPHDAREQAARRLREKVRGDQPQIEQLLRELGSGSPAPAPAPKTT